MTSYQRYYLYNRKRILDNMAKKRNPRALVIRSFKRVVELKDRLSQPSYEWDFKD